MNTWYLMIAFGIAVIVVSIILAFLIGSIPFGLIISKRFYGTDIRRSGSGNIGAMNALRTLGKRGAIAVLILDALKGFIPTSLAFHFLRDNSGDDWIVAFIALAAILGHCFSPWLGWKGGKGVATAFGALFAIAWPIGLVGIGGWLIGALLTRYSSVGSMLGNVLATIALWFATHSPWLTAYGVVAALLIIYKHRENIQRLRAGTEGAITLGKR